MKKTLIITLAIIGLISCGPSKKEAVNYNNKIIRQQIKLIEKIDELQDSFLFFNNEEISEKYASATYQVESSEEFLAKLKPFHQTDSTFKNAFKIYVKETKSVLTNEYAQIIENVKIPNEEYTQKNEATYNELSDKVEDKLLKAQDDFMRAQNNFASKFKIEIENDNTEEETE